MAMIEPGDPRYRAKLHDRDSMLRTKGLTREFGRVRALVQVNLEVRRGDFFGLVGSNGAGKTTLLRLAAGLIAPTEGSIWVGGYSTRIWTGMVRRQIGYLPDSVGIDERVRVHQYLEFFALLQRVPAAERRAIVFQALEHVGLADRWADEVTTLSRGMQQRLALSRLLLRTTQLWLLDEPVSGLDPRARIEVLDLLQTLNRAGLTIIISSHILHDLERYCNRIGVLERGQLRYTGLLADGKRTLEAEAPWLIQVAGESSPALRWLEQRPEVVHAGLEATGRRPRLRVQLPEGVGDPGAVIAALIGAGFRVQAVAREAVTLHDVFVRHTEGQIA